MKLTCIYENPEGDAVVNPSSEFISALFDRPLDFWNGGGNGASLIMHVILDPSDKVKPIYRKLGSDGVCYALIDQEQSLLMKQPVLGRFFMMIAERCAVDLTQSGEIIVDECCGNPFPIHPAYTVDLPTARLIAIAFANDPRGTSHFEWRAHSEMEVDWEAYI